MVMIPKPGKDHGSVKGWRPIVLAQTAGKLADKVIADTLQQADIFHNLQYGSRKQRPAMDAPMLSISQAPRATKSGLQAAMLGKDVVSAFNHLRKEGTLESLSEAGVS